MRAWIYVYVRCDKTDAMDGRVHASLVMLLSDDGQSVLGKALPSYKALSASEIIASRALIAAELGAVVSTGGAGTGSQMEA